MRIALVVNPLATRTRAGLRSKVAHALAPHGLEEVLVTRVDAGAQRLAATALERGAELVVALGGDGTVSAVADVLAGTETPMVPLPSGGTNVFARACGWPASPERALAELLLALEAPRRRRLALGRLVAGPHERVFCVNVGVGIDAEVVHRVEARPALKRLLRQGHFAAATLAAATRLSRDEPELSVVSDGDAPVRVATVLAACGEPYSFLGPRPLHLVPGATFEGELRWVGLRRLTTPAVAMVVAGALGGGRHLERDTVLSGTATRSIEVFATRATAVQADGEPLGWHREVRIMPGELLVTLDPPRLKR